MKNILLVPSLFPGTFDGYVNVLSLLISFHLCFSKNGMTAIHVAALFGQTEVVQEFLSRAPKSALFVSEVTRAFLYSISPSFPSPDPGRIQLFYGQ